jgi:hypothetical protein
MAILQPRDRSGIDATLTSTDETTKSKQPALTSRPPPPDGKPGRPVVFSDAAIRFCLPIRVLFRLPLRQMTGMVASLLTMDEVPLDLQTRCPLTLRQRWTGNHVRTRITARMRGLKAFGVVVAWL